MLLSYPRRRTYESLGGGAEFESCGVKSRPCDSPEHPGEKPNSVLLVFTTTAFCLISVSATTGLSREMGLPGFPRPSRQNLAYTGYCVI